MKIQPVSFAVHGLFFSMKLVGYMRKVIKLLLTELVGQCRNIFPLAFSALTTFGRSIRERPRAIYSRGT